MRTATERRKYGLVRAGGRLDTTFDVSVYLDSVDVTLLCQCADDILGFVVLYTTAPRTIDPVTNVAYRTLRFGDVAIFACEKD